MKINRETAETTGPFGVFVALFQKGSPVTVYSVGPDVGAVTKYYGTVKSWNVKKLFLILTMDNGFERRFDLKKLVMDDWGYEDDDETQFVTYYEPDPLYRSQGF